MLKDDGVIREIKWGSNFGYILEDSRYFADTEYKFLSGQTNEIFIQCMRMLYNGQTELFYVTDDYCPVSVLFSDITPDLFINIIINIFSCILEVRNNGFLSCSSIDISWDKIFADANTLKVRLVYLPLNVKEYGSYSEFESALRSNIIKLINRLFTDSNSKVEELAADLMSVSMSVEDICDKYRGVRQTARGQEKSGHRTPTESAVKLIALGTAQHFEIEINRDEMILGRNQTVADAVIPFSKKIGRKHCRISRSNSDYYITDEDSKNGTYVNQTKIQPHQPVAIHRGDVIRLADSDFQLV